MILHDLRRRELHLSQSNVDSPPVSRSLLKSPGTAIKFRPGHNRHFLPQTDNHTKTRKKILDPVIKGELFGILTMRFVSP